MPERLCPFRASLRRTTKHQAGICQLAPRSLDPLLCGAALGVTLGDLGGLERAQHAPETVWPEDVGDTADLGPPAGQRGEYLDVASRKQGRACRVARAYGDGRVPADLLQKRFGMQTAQRAGRFVVAVVTLAVFGFGKLVHDRDLREALKHPGR